MTLRISRQNVLELKTSRDFGLIFDSKEIEKITDDDVCKIDILELLLLNVGRRSCDNGDHQKFGSSSDEDEILKYILKNEEELKTGINNLGWIFSYTPFVSHSIFYQIESKVLFRKLFNLTYNIILFNILIESGKVNKIKDIEKSCEPRAALLYRHCEISFLGETIFGAEIKIEDVMKLTVYLIRSGKIFYLSGQSAVSIITTLINNNSRRDDVPDSPLLSVLIEFLICLDDKLVLQIDIINKILSEIPQRKSKQTFAKILIDVKKLFFRDEKTISGCDDVERILEVLRGSLQMEEIEKFCLDERGGQEKTTLLNKNLKIIELFDSGCKSATTATEIIKKLYETDDESKRLIKQQGAYLLCRFIRQTNFSMPREILMRREFFRKLFDSKEIVVEMLKSNTAGCQEFLRQLTNRSNVFFEFIPRVYNKLKLISPNIGRVFHQVFAEFLNNINECQVTRWSIVTSQICFFINLLNSMKFDEVNYGWVFNSYKMIFKHFDDVRVSTLLDFLKDNIKTHQMQQCADELLAHFLWKQTIFYKDQLKIDAQLFKRKSLQALLWRADGYSLILEVTEGTREKLTKYIEENLKEFASVVVFKFHFIRRHWFTVLCKTDTHPLAKIVTVSENLNEMKIGERVFTRDPKFTSGLIDPELNKDLLLVTKKLFEKKPSADTDQELCSACNAPLIVNETDGIYQKPKDSHGVFICERCASSSDTVISCGVCLSDKAQLPVIFDCRHVLCSACFGENSERCPYCRAKIEDKTLRQVPLIEVVNYIMSLLK